MAIDTDKLEALHEAATDGPDRELDVAIARVMRTTVWLRNDEDTANYAALCSKRTNA